MLVFAFLLFISQACNQNLLDILLSQWGVGMLQTFVDGDVVCHLVDTAVVDADLTKVHGDVDALLCSFAQQRTRRRPGAMGGVGVRSK